MKNDKPTFGRLNDLNTLFQISGHALEQAKNNMGLMLKEWLLKTLMRHLNGLTIK